MKIKRFPLSGFAYRLNDSLLKSGLEKSQLAERIGVSKNSVFNYCNGESEPQASVLGKICKILNVTSDYLLFGNKED